MSISVFGKTLSCKIPLAAATALVATLALAGAAAAQPLRPNILIVFDTSTSMLASTGCPAGATGGRCDGSPLCGGAGQTSRLFRLKQAIRETLTEVGTDEANFGLAHFPEEVTPGMNRGCYRGHYVNSEADGCRTSAASETADGNWFTPAIAGEFVAVPVTRTMTPAAADFDPRGANVTEIYRWLDNEEVSNGTTLTNPEIRSGGAGTPLAASLFYSRLYFDRFVKPADPRARCRKNIVILVTDGAESCNGDAPTRAAETFGAGVEVYVVVQSGEQGTVHDQIADRGSGGKRKQSIKVDFTNPTATKAALLGIIAEAVPPSETCNGEDDNCNDVVDEAPLPGVGGACLCPGTTEAHVGRGMCKKGMLVCDGKAGISCKGCMGPGVEICNGVDDDCDGDVDEDFLMLGRACENSLKGACNRKGIFVCSPDRMSVVCDASPAEPSKEICNGIDDDCNGMTDEGALEGVGQACGGGVSAACVAGKTKCEGGRLVCDTMMGSGSEEKCNGLDDNCDGVVDNGVKGEGDVCACAPHDLKTLMTGECSPGKLMCNGKEPLDCAGCVPPRAETCDGKDNNCDGMIDNGATCGGQFVCKEGTCRIPCGSGEFPCPSGFACDRETDPPTCKSLKCANKKCAEGWTCNEGNGECEDPCKGISCNAPQVCRAGKCVDCHSTGCPGGQVCVSGKCEANPCAGVRCAQGQFCEAGACVGLCSPSCAPGEVCVKGQCKGDPCSAISCPGGQVCDPLTSQCKTDACLVKRCGLQQVCVRTTGECRNDPCATVSCPQNGCYQCAVTNDGLPQCRPIPDCVPRVTQIDATGGGGCGCAVPGTPAGAPVGPIGALVVGLLALGLRRRRR